MANDGNDGGMGLRGVQNDLSLSQESPAWFRIVAKTWPPHFHSVYLLPETEIFTVFHEEIEAVHTEDPQSVFYCQCKQRWGKKPHS